MHDQSAMLAAQYGRYTAQNAAAQDYQSFNSQLSQSPRVICEQLRPDTQVYIH